MHRKAIRTNEWLLFFREEGRFMVPDFKNTVNRSMQSEFWICQKDPAGNFNILNLLKWDSSTKYSGKRKRKVLMKG